MSTERTVAVRGGLIRTMDTELPKVECLAVRNGRVEAIGSTQEVEALVGKSAEWLDLRPAVIVPGLTDSHIHLVEWALGLAAPDLSGASSMAEALAHVESITKGVPLEGWVEFKGWKPDWRRDAELPDLDRASGGRAVALVAHDLHSAWLNSEALRRLEVAPGRADPQGGSVERDAEGRPTGVLKERALDWWYEGRPKPSVSERRAAVREGQAVLHRLGITAIQSVEAPESFQVVDDLERGGELRLRVLHHWPQRYLSALIECGIRSGFGNQWLRVGGIKYFTDGALGSRTAYMLEPYEGSGDRGMLRMQAEELSHDVERAAQAGLAATVHAIGDAAVRMTLDVLEGAGQVGLRIPHRVEHLQCVHREDFGRAAQLGVVASMQPSHLLTDIRLAEEHWGAERCRGTMVLRTLRSLGTTLAFGSDAPVEAPDPREGFYAAVARRDRAGYPADGWNPEERLTGAEVLEAYTLGPARAAGESGRRGRLAPGYLADFAAWDIDLAIADPEQLCTANVVATVVDGEVVYRD